MIKWPPMPIEPFVEKFGECDEMGGKEEGLAFGDSSRWFFYLMLQKRRCWFPAKFPRLQRLLRTKLV